MSESTEALKRQAEWVFDIVGFIDETNPRLAALTKARIDALPLDFSTQGGMLQWFLDSKHIALDAMKAWHLAQFGEPMPDDWLEKREPLS